ncbi:ferredoxin-thioredoxin reductase catalytic chain, chloroplastic [Iris pallida]|uniref:Ferredoxin-thioredoxin reductase catalytic chain, chloroplastic n=1 Tax=Iris pallida TaxID=29817 RepID=A0AAX6ET02_IRIPA|nr:ferredoxin-thioredoxin reductase catalytic chain, chloroplastic [Iris pallida]
MSIQSSFSGVGLLPCLAPVPSPRRSRHRILAKAEPSEKSVELMRKFSEQYARRSGTYFCVDKGVTSVVIKVNIYKY